MKLSDLIENQHLFKLPEFPQQTMLKEGYYMVRGATNERVVKWFVHRLMEDEEEIYGVVTMDPGNRWWTYVSLAPKPGEQQLTPASLDFFKLDKLKDFVNGQLAHFGAFDV